MIFGFNTDVRHGDTIYHVQSEAQQRDTLLQTHIFVGGQCVGKCELSLTDSLLQSVEKDVQEALKLQHRQVLDAIREGHVESLLASGDLQLEWLEASSRADGKGLLLLFRVMAGNSPLSAACVVGRLDAGERSLFARSESTAGGICILEYPVQRDCIGNSTLLIEATHAGRKASSRYRLHAGAQPSAALPVVPMF